MLETQTTSRPKPNTHQRSTGRLHLDRRIGDLLKKGQALSPDALIKTVDLADWLGVSPQWVEIARHRGDGPPYLRLSARKILYKVSSVLGWLGQREFRATAQYPNAQNRCS